MTRTVKFAGLLFAVSLVPLRVQAQTGAATAGQVSVSVFRNQSTPAASTPLRNIGQTSHTLYVAAHSGTSALPGVLCRLEAAMDGATWFPISVDVTFLPALSPSGLTTKPYAIVKANGVYPYLRVDCPAVPAAIDVNYVGSQYPFGDVSLQSDRFLVTSVGSNAAALGAPINPLTLDGLQSGLNLSESDWNADHPSTLTVDNTNGKLNFNVTVDNNGFFFPKDLTSHGWTHMNFFNQLATGWTTVIAKVNADWSVTSDGARAAGLVIRNATTPTDKGGPGWFFGYGRNSDGTWHFFVDTLTGNHSGGSSQTLCYTTSAFNGSYASTCQPTGLSTATSGQVPAWLQITHTAGNFVFQYSTDGTIWTTLYTIADTSWDPPLSGSPGAQTFNYVGVFATLTNGTLPSTVSMSRFKWQ